MPLNLQAGARIKDFENEFYKVCSYVDGCHLPVNCKLKLEETPEEDYTYYRLKPAENFEKEVCFMSKFRRVLCTYWSTRIEHILFYN